MNRSLLHKLLLIAGIVALTASCRDKSEPGYLRVDPNGRQQAAATDTYITFTVESNLDWTVTVTGEGFGSDKSSGSGDATLRVTFGPNESYSKTRTGNITFSARDDAAGTTRTVSIDIEQAAAESSGDDYLMIFLESREVTADTREVMLSIETNLSWTVATTHISPDFSADWIITPSYRQGTGSAETLLNFDVNYEYDRQAEIIVTAGELTRKITLAQYGKLGGTDFPKWTELPAIALDPNTLFYTHYTQVAGESARNYSVFYDKTTYTSYWVAYPMHSSYMGKGRTDKWGYDPKIPRDWQVNYSSAWGSNNYDRGHQVPSADRNATTNTGNSWDMNVQTFYYTNITPQRYQLNQFKWEGLESYLRAKVEKNTDTIWVVTGAMMRKAGGSETITYLPKTNGAGGDIQVPVPNYYFKVALWHRSSGGSKQYTSVGFWMDNVDSGTDKGIYRSDAYTVRDIEQLTGFDFFANIPVSEQEKFETVVGEGWF